MKPSRAGRAWIPGVCGLAVALIACGDDANEPQVMDDPPPDDPPPDDPPPDDPPPALPRTCGDMSSCPSGTGCVLEDKRTVCIDVDNTELYPGPCAVEEHWFIPEWRPEDGIADNTYLDSLTYKYDGTRPVELEANHHDDGGDGTWGFGSFSYDDAGELTRFDYYSTVVVSFSPFVGTSWIFEADRVTENAHREFVCEDSERDARICLADLEPVAAVVYARERFAFVPLFPADFSSVAFGTILSGRVNAPETGTKQADCERIEQAPRTFLDRCTDSSGVVVFERDVVLDEQGRTLEQTDHPIADGYPFPERDMKVAYDAAGAVESIQYSTTAGPMKLRYVRDAAGNPVYAERTSEDVGTGELVFDYGCWK